jgi:hypothetical protein
MRLLLPTLAVTSDTSVLVEEELREELIAGRWLPAHPEMPDWDDGQTVISVVFFESKDAYQRLASDPAQDVFWRERSAPLLDGEPQWFDGTWLETLVPLL